MPAGQRISSVFIFQKQLSQGQRRIVEARLQVGTSMAIPCFTFALVEFEVCLLAWSTNGLQRRGQNSQLLHFCWDFRVGRFDSSMILPASPGLPARAATRLQGDGVSAGRSCASPCPNNLDAG